MNQIYNKRSILNKLSIKMQALLFTMLISIVSLEANSMACERAFLTKLNSTRLVNLFARSVSPQSLEEKQDFQLEYTQDLILQSLAIRGAESLFSAGISQALTSSFNKNVSLSSVNLRIAFLEKMILDNFSQKKPTSFEDDKLELNKNSVYDLFSIFQSQDQLLYLRKPNAEIRDFESLYHTKLDEIYKEIMSKTQSKTNRGILFTEVSERLNKVKEQFLFELKKKHIAVSVLPFNSLKLAISKTHLQPYIYSQTRTGQKEWRADVLRVITEDSVTRIDRKHFADKLVEHLDNLDNLILPIWRVNEQIIGSQLSINVAQDVNWEDYRSFLTPYYYSIQAVFFNHDGEIYKLHLKNVFEEGSWTKIQLHIDDLMTMYDLAVRFEAINSTVLRENGLKDLVVKENIEPINNKPISAIPSFIKVTNKAKEAQKDLSHDPAQLQKERSAKGIKNVKQKKLDRKERHEKQRQEQLEKKRVHFESQSEEHSEVRAAYADVREIESFIHKELRGHHLSAKVKQLYHRFEQNFKEGGLDRIISMNGYHFEALRGSQKGFSVRLNSNYRLFLAIGEKDSRKRLLVLHIGNHDYDYYHRHIIPQLESLVRDGYTLY